MATPLARLLESPLAPNPVQVHAPAASFKFVEHAYGKLPRGDVAAHFTGRFITASSDCSGIGGKELADAMVANGAAAVLRRGDSGEACPALPAVRYKTLWAIENDSACQAELLSMADGPACLFRDVLDFVCPCHRQAAGLDAGLEESPRVLRSLLPLSLIHI
eukprot:15454330-Alexandrium_andersonii.AAC.1